MEIGILLFIGAAGAALGYFWLSGVVSGERRMAHRA